MCCPGWADTDMGSIMCKLFKISENGARIPIRLAFVDAGGVRGKC